MVYCNWLKIINLKIDRQLEFNFSTKSMALPADVKKYIRQQFRALKEETNCNDDLLDEMVAQNIFNRIDKQEIMAESIPDIRNSKFYDKMMTKGLDGYNRTITVLKICEQLIPAEILERRCDTANNTAPAPSSSYPIPVKKIDFHANVTPLQVVVKHSAKFMDDPEMDYKMRSKSRGLALIISNTNFSDGRIREGGHEDSVYIRQLLTSLGYESTYETNVKHSELQDVIENVKKKLKDRHLNLDSFIVVIMSHGGRDCIEMADGRTAALWTDIVYKFADFLPDKPKIFIIAACQGFGEAGQQDRFEKVVPMRDTLICFASQPGTPARRDVYLGTWFIYCLTKVFMENAHNKHLLEMLKTVQTTLCEGLEAGENLEMQQCYWYDLLRGEKKVYFNPGLSEP